MKISDCVAIVSGGASGLGEATVRMMEKGSGQAAIFDFNEERGEKIASDLGSSVIFCKVDVTDEKSIQLAIKRAMDAFGAIHAVVNCAGIATPVKVIGKNGAMPISLFNQILNVNLTGSMNVIRLATEKMVENSPRTEDGEKGVVINTASVAAFDGQIGQAGYSASKAGIVGMTLPVAREFAEYGIRVNAIAPGLFETPLLEGLPEKAKASLAKMVPFPKRLGKPFELSGLVRTIIENAMINGEVIRLDGGIRMEAK